MPLQTGDPKFRSTSPGIETLPGKFNLPRHRHLQAYASIVLSGSFEESGYVGRLRACAGDVLVHPALDCHANQMVSAGLQLLRLDWCDIDGIGGFYHLDEIDELAHTAERDPGEATLMLKDLLKNKRPTPSGKRNDWPDILASDVATNPALEIGAWAHEHGLAQETLSRGFRLAYGTTPVGFRAELRTRAAWLLITRGSNSLCTIAAETGFSDQAHMTRWIQRVTGAPPAAWRHDSLNQGRQ